MAANDPETRLVIATLGAAIRDNRADVPELRARLDELRARAANPEQEQDRQLTVALAARLPDMPPAVRAKFAHLARRLAAKGQLDLGDAA
jgi:hypothetical protein